MLLGQLEPLRRRWPPKWRTPRNDGYVRSGGCHRNGGDHRGGRNRSRDIALIALSSRKEKTGSLAKGGLLRKVLEGLLGEEQELQLLLMIEVKAVPG